MTHDTIIIVRHGKPALSRKTRLNWGGFREWWGLYDKGGLQDKQRLPKKVKAYAEQADLVISSPLRRAAESAKLARGRDADILDPDLVEAALPPPKLWGLKFGPKTWGTMARVLWYFGWSDGLESHKDARARADRMADKLADHAAGGKLVFVTAHGWFNRMLKGSLMKRGWKCVSQNGDLHWSHRRLIRPTQIED